jgi:hypothetical protein
VIIGSFYEEPPAISLLDGVSSPLLPMVSRTQSERTLLAKCECERAVRNHQLINPSSVSFVIRPVCFRNPAAPGVRICSWSRKSSS